MRKIIGNNNNDITKFKYTLSITMIVRSFKVTKISFPFQPTYSTKKLLLKFNIISHCSR